MFKKILIIGLLGLAQCSWCMEDQMMHNEIENAYIHSERFDEIKEEIPDWRQRELEYNRKIEARRNKEAREEYMGYAKTIGTEYAKVYGAAYGLIFAHEFGHWAAGRFLLKEKGFIFISPLQFLPSSGSYYLGLSSKEVGKLLASIFEAIVKKNENLILLPPKRSSFEEMKIFFPKIPYAVMLAAGPLSGFLGSYLLLKGNTFAYAYEKNGGNAKNALQEMQEKSLFNNTQNFLLQLLAALHIHGNLIQNLYPWGNKPTFDGDRIFDVLNIKNTRPLLRKTIGMSLGTLTACALGKSIFDAWKDKS